MVEADVLEDVQIASSHLIRRALEVVEAGDLAEGDLLPEIELRYRLIGIAKLLREADQTAFRDALHRSACTALHHFTLFRQGLEMKHVNLTVQDNPGFADAVICGDLGLAAELAALLPESHRAGFEYEEDFLRYHFLHRMLLGDSDDALSEILSRWTTVVEGRASSPLDLSRALLHRDAEAFDETLGILIEEHAGFFEAFRTSNDYVPEIEATLGKIWMNGLVALRFAELRGMPTRPEYRFMPALARLPVDGPFPARDAWRTPPVD
jgi:hypothetical protein